MAMRSGAQLVAQVHLGLAAVLDAPHGPVLDARELAAVDQVEEGAHGGLGHAACGAEDLSGAAEGAHPRIVAGARLEVGQPDALALEQARDELAGREHRVHVGTAVSRELGAQGLLLLGGAGQ